MAYMPPSITITSIKDSNGNTMSPYCPTFTVAGTLSPVVGGTIYGLMIDSNTGNIVCSQSTPAAANWSLPQFNLTGQQPAGTQYTYFCKVSLEATTHDDAGTGTGINVQF